MSDTPLKIGDMVKHRHNRSEAQEKTIGIVVGISKELICYVEWLNPPKPLVGVSGYRITDLIKVSL